MRIFDVAIIGAGPAGMMAAGHAGQNGRQVLLLEKNKRVGRKLDITGGGRCNITNATYDNRELLKNYGDKAKFLHSTFAQHSVKDTVKFFEYIGIDIVEQVRKRCFPKSECAPDVTRALRQFVNQSGRVETKLSTKVTSITKDEDSFTIQTNKGDFKSKKLVIATGGTSHPETGATGEGFGFLSKLGHDVIEPNPNLVPLTVDETHLTGSVSGTSLTFMKISFWQKGKAQFSEIGKVLFTHFGLSGPLILNSSYRVKELSKAGPVTATIDMFPDTEFDQLDDSIVKIFNQQPNKLLRNVFKEIVPKGMTPLFEEKYPANFFETRLHSVTKEARRKLVHDLKGLELTITGNMGEDWAIVADGGVQLHELDTKTMESKVCAGLYVIGDCLNINRPSGGFSLQLCWTTGFVAGVNI